MADERSLTQDEAARRAGLLHVERYDLDVDLTGLLDGPELRATATITFACREPGAQTFVDCLADVEEAVLNGAPLGTDAVREGRITLADLRDENVLVVRSVQRTTDQGRGVHRAVDPADKEVYVWTTFEPDDARVVFACFDQPDLKAPFGIRVTAPGRWTVLSNSGDAEVSSVEGGRLWVFADTPPLSTYVPVVNAGPLHELRSERAGHDLGLYARRSLAPMLERDAAELFDLTARGLAFFGQRFELPFPQRRYDQAFMPELSGAMENYGCVTWSDAYIYRDEPSYAERELRAAVLLHEMAHMWFGDMVTMRWWDDLWLNESFAEWACAWAAENATEFTGTWAGMLATDKLTAYAADLAPTTHPIRQPIPDVAAAAAAFDSITYPKGAAVLKQLVAHVGEDAFVTALASYFRKHAWASTTLDDLIAELELSSGRDLSGWVSGWLGTSGTDRIALERSDGVTALRVTPPGGRGPLPHRLDVGVYDEQGTGFVRRTTVPVQVEGELTAVPGADDAALLLVNDDDLTFASVRPDPASLQTLLSRGGLLPTPLGRTLAVTTVWDMLVRGDLSAADVVACVAGVLPHEDADSVVEPMLKLAADAADHWAPAHLRDRLLSTLADTCLELGRRPQHALAASRMLARTATTEVQLGRLDALATTPAMQWRRLARLAELGRLDEAEVAGLLERDPNPDAWVDALAVRAARADEDCKAQAWQSVFEDRKLPVGALIGFGGAFWRPGQDEVLAPYADRFVDALPAMGDSGMLWAISLSLYMFPKAGVDTGYPGRIDEAAQRPDVSAVVRANVRERADVLARMLRARAA
jgi:aminopeptidase N